MRALGLRSHLGRPETRRFVTFLGTGGLAALLNILSRIGFEPLLRAGGFGPVASYEIAVLLAYGVGMTSAFFLAKAFVFTSSGRRLHVEYGRFALVNVAALVQVWTVSVLSDRLILPALGVTWNAETIAHVVGVLSPVLLSYHGHKRFSFG